MPSCCACGQVALLVVIPTVGARVCEACALELSPTVIQVPLRECQRRYAFFEYAGSVVPLLSRAKDEAFGSHYYAVQYLFTAAAMPLIGKEKLQHALLNTISGSNGFS